MSLNNQNILPIAIEAMKMALEIVNKVSDSTVSESSKIVAAGSIMPALLMLRDMPDDVEGEDDKPGDDS